MGIELGIKCRAVLGGLLENGLVCVGAPRHPAHLQDIHSQCGCEIFLVPPTLGASLHVSAYVWRTSRGAQVEGAQSNNSVYCNTR